MIDDVNTGSTDVVSELAGIRLGAGDTTQVLEQIVALTRRALPGAVEVSITLVEGDKEYTAAFTGPLALDLDERQYEAGYGPCLDAARAGMIIIIDDMATEARWPEYTPRAVERGANSSLSISLPVQDVVTGGLNIYGGAAGAFGESDVKVGSRIAGYAAIAVANANLYADTAARADQMWEAMQSRAVIEQAKGVLMRDQRCSEDEAFDMLRIASNHSNRKLRDIAVAIVRSAQRGA